MDDDGLTNTVTETVTEQQQTPDTGNGNAGTEETKSLLDDQPGDTGKQEPEGQKPDEKTEEKPVRSLLDDPEEKPEGEQQAEENPPAQEDIDRFKAQVKEVVDLGEGVEYDDAALNAMAVPLMRLTGGDPAKTKEVIKAYTDFKRGEENARIEDQNTYAKALSAECTQRFGKDLPIFAKDAREGGYKVFGDKLWDTLRKIPQIGCNPDMIERLAAINRKFSSDTGVVPGDDKKPSSSPGWVNTMYGGIGKQ